jgi:hypothetical protein
VSVFGYVNRLEPAVTADLFAIVTATLMQKSLTHQQFAIATNFLAVWLVGRVGVVE